MVLLMKFDRKPWVGLMTVLAAMTAASVPAPAQRWSDVKMLITADTDRKDFGMYPGTGKGKPRVIASLGLLTSIDVSSALPIQFIEDCYFTQSSTGGFTIEYCRPSMPWQFYELVPLRRYRRDGRG
jgi:hypothetical protein